MIPFWRKPAAAPMKFSPFKREREENQKQQTPLAEEMSSSVFHSFTDVPLKPNSVVRHHVTLAAAFIFHLGFLEHTRARTHTHTHTHTHIHTHIPGDKHQVL